MRITEFGAMVFSLSLITIGAGFVLVVVWKAIAAIVVAFGVKGIIAICFLAIGLFCWVYEMVRF